MHRFRGTDVVWGILAIVVNVVLVVGVVLLVSGRGGSSPSAGLPAASTTSSASPSPSPSPSPSAQTGTTQALFERRAPLTIAVLGDQTSDGKGEWVSEMAELLGRDHQVTVHQLDPQDPTVYADQQTFGSTGPTVTIYNGSRPEARADYAAKRLAFLSPGQPDLVILNYGRNDSAATVGKRLDVTAKAVRAMWKKSFLAVTLQPPTTGDDAKKLREAVQAWAKDGGVLTLDVAKAFLVTGQADTYVSPRDALAMTGSGDRLWGETAYKLLVGHAPPEVAPPATPTVTPTAQSSTASAIQPSTNEPRRTTTPRRTTDPPVNTPLPTTPIETSPGPTISGPATSSSPGPTTPTESTAPAETTSEPPAISDLPPPPRSGTEQRTRE